MPQTRARKRNVRPQGKTPREAIRTAQGRAAVDVLLKDFENHEQRSPPEVRFDFAEIRRDLGLPA